MRRGNAAGSGFLAAVVVLATVSCDAKTQPEQLVLLITVDTLRADRIGAFGSERGLTPRLDGLARESEVFEAMYAPASFTVPSISTILTGRYPEQNSIFTNESILHDRVDTIASLMKERGYRTGAVVSNWVLRGGGGLERGFDEYDARFPQAEVTRKIPERVATTTTDDALEMLDRLNDGPNGSVFLWVHYQDPHGPYTAPDNYVHWVADSEVKAEGAGRLLPFGTDSRGLGSIPTYQRLGDNAQAESYRISYDAEVRYTDAEIGRLLEAIADRGLYERAVIAFAADHGEGLGERDYWFAHGEYLSDPLVRVPFFVRIPGRAGHRRDQVTALVDVLPSVLSVLGIEPPSGLPGRNLLQHGEPGEESVAYLATLRASTVPRFGVVSDGFKYVVTVRSGQTEEQLFREGDERNDLKDAEPEQLAHMRRTLRVVRARFQPERAELKRDFYDGDRERLRALGYVNP